MRTINDRGAVAVEMALLLPLLLFLLLGIMEFGRAFNAQVTLTNAAREAVREMAIGGVASKAKTAAKDAAVTLNPELTDADVSVGACVDDAHIVTITYELTTLTGIAGPFTLTGKGVMRCGG
ncbi:Flp pilus assembly protein TadG [Arthrobacter pigmenti]|uniref:Flp pilus assembly protein TadG n=1 Tax=Arthrobacter pigmenti TaxID=271432 RepID=A0A846RIL6_9MICC|nr:TadE family protein [Arthrobacter pigmenti]NJC23128.1 Flp pilus assembly protein TadG [Arthrobacter pigmenti]